MGRFRIRHRSGTSFSFRFLVAVLLLIVIEAAGLYTFSKQVTIARVDPSLLNEAGRLRLLVSQTDALTHHFRYASSDSIRAGVQQELGAVAKEMRSIRADLMNGIYAEGVRAFLEQPPAQVADRIDAYARAASLLAAADAGGAIEEAKSWIASESVRLQEDVDALSRLIEDDHRATLRRGQKAYLAGGTLTFLLLLALGLFVFMPMEQRLRNEFHESRDRERRFRLLVENAYDLISVVDESGKFTYASPSLGRMTGYAPDGVMKKSVLELIHPEDRDLVGEDLLGVVNLPSGSVTSAEFRIITKDGDERYLEAIGQNLTDDPDVHGVVVNSRDITDRKLVEIELHRYRDELERRVRDRTSQLEATNRDLIGEIERRNVAEAKLLDRERRFRKVIMGASDPIFIQELGSRGAYATYSDVNEAASRYLGYTKDELLQMSPADIVEDFEALAPENFEWMASSRTLAVEMNLKTKNGRSLPFDCRLDVLEIGDHEILICLARDISERLALEKAMREQNRTLELRVAERAAQLERRTAELEAANEELEAFAYSVSHDLRAPIRSLAGFSRLALERMNGNADESVRHYVSRIQANAFKMGALVDDLLAYSRISRATARRSHIDPRPLIDELLRDHASAGDETFEIVVEDLPRVEADPTLLRQIFQNLLSNAMKFTRDVPSPKIVVGSKCENDTTVYFVRDNGVGFDMKHADKLFGVFQRLHKSDKYEGTGAGLAIVDRIVRKHGGRIWAEARPDEGATFYFTLNDHAAE